MTSLPCLRTVPISRRSTRLHLHLTFLGAVLVCVSPAAVSAQSVSFAGASPSVNFGKVNLCPAGQTTPAPCSETLTLTYNVTAGGTLGAIKVVTGGAPNLDFTLATGSSCSGAVIQGNICTVNVNFAPKYAGDRNGAVQIADEYGDILATTFLYGFGVGPQIGFETAAQTIVPFRGAVAVPGLAADSAGDLFACCGVSRTDELTVLELPVGGGPQIELPFFGTNYTGAMAVDGAGDVFLADPDMPRDVKVLELLAGGGSQITLPFIGLGGASGVAVDGGGDVFVVDDVNSRVLELPAGGGAQITLPFNFLYGPNAIAADSAGDVFVSQSYNERDATVLKLPAGSSRPTVLPFSGLNGAEALAVAGIGDVFVADYYFPETTSVNQVVELPAGGAPQVTLPFSSLNEPESLAVDGGGDVFVGNEFSPVVYELHRSQPPPLNFGTISVGSTATLPLTITNTGTGTLTVTQSINGSSYQVLSIEPDTCLAGITAGQTCTLTIEFSPLALGAQNGTLTLQTNASTSPTVQLQGTANDVPTFSVASGVYAIAQTVSITDSAPGTIYYTTNGTPPTASSTPYKGPISVTSTETLEAISIAAGAPSAIATATYTIASGTPADVINLSQGFTHALGPMQFNGSTDLDGPRLQLTDGSQYVIYGGQYEAASAFYATPVNIQSFTTNFTFQLSSPNAYTPLANIGDGITFAIQNSGASALGAFAFGEKLGYAPIGKSVAIKFDLHNNAGEGPNSTGLYVDGALPTVPAVDLTGTGIDLHSGDGIFAQITYDGTNLVLTLTDTVTFASWSHSFAINIPATVGGDSAYIGFTGATGLDTANQEILSWTYTSGTPGPPAPLPSIPSAPHYPAGFNGVGLAMNGSTALVGSALQLTDGGQDEAGSAFYATPVTIDQSFTTDFTFQLSRPNASVPLASIADGITFTILNAEPYVVAAGDTALGGLGDALGYAGIVNNASGGYNNFDMAIKFDLHNNAGEGPNSTGLYVNGASPTVPAIDLTGTGIDLHSGHPFRAHIAYDYAATNLTLTLTDATTLAMWSHSFTIDIPRTIGAVTAYIGFTGATGADVAVQQILSWTFTIP